MIGRRGWAVDACACTHPPPPRHPSRVQLGEDPYVGAQFAAAFIRGTIDAAAAIGYNYTVSAATAKHFFGWVGAWRGWRMRGTAPTPPPLPPRRSYSAPHNGKDR
jgi:hypothetical protein